MEISIQRRSLLAGATLMGLGSAVPARAASQHDDTWHDAARQRDVALRLNLPGTPGPWPLVLVSHGLGGSREGGAVWAEAWAEGGLAVLRMQHPGSDEAIWRGGMLRVRAAASARQLLERCADVRFVLDEVQRRAATGEAPWRDLLPQAIGLSGHSFGAHTTLAVAGQRYRIPVRVADPRPRAFMAFSPALPDDAKTSAQDAFGAIARPCMVLTGSLDGDPLNGRFKGGEPRARVFDGLTGVPAGQRALLWLEGADHMTFGGGRMLSAQGRGPLRREPLALEREGAHHALVARVTLLWWRAQLLGDARARAEIDGPPSALGLGPGDRLTRA